MFPAARAGYAIFNNSVDALMHCLKLMTNIKQVKQISERVNTRQESSRKNVCPCLRGGLCEKRQQGSRGVHRHSDFHAGSE